MQAFDTIVIDPPWPVKKIVRKCRPNQTAQLDYPTMKLDEIAKINPGTIGTENCVMFLWTTQKFLPYSFQLMDEWGFRYQRVLTWDKKGGVCFFGFHHRTEFVLFGYRGKLPMYPKRKAMPTLLTEMSIRHSRKPDIFYKWAEVFGSSRIDIFGREHREGRHTVGNEINGKDIFDELRELNESKCTV